MLTHALNEADAGAGRQATFALLLIDGLSLREEFVASALHASLGDIPLFGGSAGDGLEFRRTHVFHSGVFHRDAAALVLVSTPRPFRVFKTQHFVRSDLKLVITAADPARRVVHEINGRPAAEEYARLLDLQPDQLDPTVFATYPLVVRVAGSIHVRSIQRADPNGSLTFYCAIDEGLVLSIAKGVDLVQNLEHLLDDIVRDIGHPELIIGCDCILRNIEMQRRGLKDTVGDLLVRHGAVGFSTYGEQFNAMHVNQTFTGVAIGPGGWSHESA